MVEFLRTVQDTVPMSDTIIRFTTDIDFGATPDRTRKAITFRSRVLDTEVDDGALGGYSYKFKVPVLIDVFERAISIEGQRSKPQNLKQIEKYLTEWIALNRLSLTQQGVSNMQIRSTQTIEDTDTVKDQVWYRLMIVVDTFYFMHRQ